MRDPSGEMVPDYNVLISSETAARAQLELDQIRSGSQPGKRLAAVLQHRLPAGPDLEFMIEALLQTKSPQYFAESQVIGDGRDWTASELSLLGDISLAMQVTVFDNGRHKLPDVHPHPFEAVLLFTPGALLRNDAGANPADWNEVVKDGAIDPEAYYRLYERRLLPPLRFADQFAAAQGQRALVTVPGIGCGQFAGEFHGQLGEEFSRVLARLLRSFGSELPNLAALYFDPFNECDNARSEIHGIQYLVRPLTKGNPDKPQLCPPQAYAESGDDFGGCLLFSFVAWDPVSWPGNDFYIGRRVTDDGVKAAATSAMKQVTGLNGWYDPKSFCYRPPAPYQIWQDVVFERNLKLETAGRLRIF